MLLLYWSYPSLLAFDESEIAFVAHTTCTHNALMWWRWSLLPLLTLLSLLRLFFCNTSVERHIFCQPQLQLQAISWKEPSQLKIAKTTLMLSVSIQICSKHPDWIVNNVMCYLLLSYWVYIKNILRATKHPWYPLSAFSDVDCSELCFFTPSVSLPLFSFMSEQMLIYTARENSCLEAPVDWVTKTVWMCNENTAACLCAQRDASLCKTNKSNKTNGNDVGKWRGKV